MIAKGQMNQPLTFWVPRSSDYRSIGWSPLAYLAGTLKGDAWLGVALGLRVKDIEFAECFALAIYQVFGLLAKVAPCRGKYYEVRWTSIPRFSILKSFSPRTKCEMACWLRGLFDSEGTASIIAVPRVSENSKQRYVGFVSTSKQTLLHAKCYLKQLGIECGLYPRKPSGKKNGGYGGTRKPWALVIIGGLHAYSKFRFFVNSSIPRKYRQLSEIIHSYDLKRIYLSIGGQR